MLSTVWSPKGGSGASVVAAGIALAVAERRGCLLVDLGGDQSSILGLADPGPGVRDWLAADAGPDALARLARPVTDGLALIGPGDAPGGAADGRRVAGRRASLVRALAALPHDVVVDASPAASELIEGADRSIVVVRACYLALRRFHRIGLPAHGVVVVREPRRAIEPAEVGEVVGLPVLAVVDQDPSVARVVDAGRFAADVPRSFARALRRVA